VKPSLWPFDLRARRLVSVGLLAAAFAFSGCNKVVKQTDMGPLDSAGMQFDTINQLRNLQVTDVEVQQLALVHQDGISDQTCLVLVRIAHERHQLFTNSEPVAGLIGAGLQENTIIELARLDQVTAWGGEAVALHLAGAPDALILEVARRRAAGQPVISEPNLVNLRNAGMSDSQLIAFVQRGTTDAQADQMLAQHERATTPHGFIRQQGRRRR
jgi:hypothetical protein